MEVDHGAPARTFSNPLPGVALGDPFVLRHRGRFYLYGTNDGPPLPDGRAVPVFRSDDLLHWEPLGGALEPQDPTAEHWAPEVLYWNGRFYMVISFGDVERRGHALWVATAGRPEGPFRLARQVSDPSERFSIDGAWLLDDDGRLYLYRCLDFVADADPPHGTGVVVQPMRDPLTPAGPPVTVLRAHARWQLFEANRVMPLYGGRTFAEWTTIEGAAPVRRSGRVFCGYSGGNYQFAYGTGEAVADDPLGPYRDLHGAEGPIFATTPGLIEGPGHFSVITPDLVHDWIVLHGRKPGEGARRVWLCPALWTRDGVRIGPLTDQPQPAPPLPTDLTRFPEFRGSLPEGWLAEERWDFGRVGVWRCDEEGLWQESPSSAELHPDASDPPLVIPAVWRNSISLRGDWVVEVTLRFPDPLTESAGIGLQSGEFRPWVAIEPVVRSCRIQPQAGGPGSRRKPLPSLGDGPFDPGVFHALEVRARAGRAEVRIDGVLLFDDWVIPEGPGRLFLFTMGPVVFDTVSVTL